MHETTIDMDIFKVIEKYFSQYNLKWGYEIFNY